MKNFAQLVLKIVVGLVSFLYNYRTSIVFKKIYRKIFSLWISKEFRSCGSTPSIQSPINLLGGQHIHIGKNFMTYARLRIEALSEFNGQSFNPKLIIGNDVSFNFDCHIACIDNITIGNNVLIASKVFITDHLHGDNSDLTTNPSLRPLITKGGVYIEDDVLIGENVAIMPGVVIGKGSVIGANSVVTKTVEAYSVYAGVPAKKIK